MILLGIVLIALGSLDYFFHIILPGGEKAAYYIMGHFISIGTIEITAVVVGILLFILGLNLRKNRTNN